MIWFVIALGIYANEVYTSEKNSIANNPEYKERIEFLKAELDE